MKIKLEVGNEAMDYPYGDFLNAVNGVVDYFDANRKIDLSMAAKHLHLLADKIELDSFRQWKDELSEKLAKDEL